jgi:hypothetical protein
MEWRRRVWKMQPAGSRRNNIARERKEDKKNRRVGCKLPHVESLTFVEDTWSAFFDEFLLTTLIPLAKCNIPARISRWGSPLFSHIYETHHTIRKKAGSRVSGEFDAACEGKTGGIKPWLNAQKAGRRRKQKYRASNPCIESKYQTEVQEDLEGECSLEHLKSNC